MAYADVNDMLEMTETLISGMANSIIGSSKVKYHPKGPSAVEWDIDFSPPFRRISMIPELERILKCTFPPAETLASIESNIFLSNICTKYNIECPSPRTSARILDKLVSEFIEPQCISPTFITDHPLIMSPLAKSHRSKPGLSERFECFVATKEICNAYTELNDPFEQRERFKQQAIDSQMGDEEAQLIDEDFCKSLEYGLPPTAGWGIFFLTEDLELIALQ